MKTKGFVHLAVNALQLLSILIKWVWGKQMSSGKCRVENEPIRKTNQKIEIIQRNSC